MLNLFLEFWGQCRYQSGQINFQLGGFWQEVKRCQFPWKPYLTINCDFCRYYCDQFSPIHNQSNFVLIIENWEYIHVIISVYKRSGVADLVCPPLLWISISPRGSIPSLFGVTGTPEHSRVSSWDTTSCGGMFLFILDCCFGFCPQSIEVYRWGLPSPEPQLWGLGTPNFDAVPKFRESVGPRLLPGCLATVLLTLRRCGDRTILALIKDVRTSSHQFP